jgi:hypothetical protein
MDARHTTRMRTAVRTAEWTNGAGIRVKGAYQFDNVEQEFVFRIIGSNGVTVPAVPVITSAESFKWDEPVVINRA